MAAQDDLEQVEVRDLQEELSRLRSLREHPGWTMFQKVIKRQLELRKQQHFQSAKSLEDILVSEFQKGEIAYGEFVLVLVDLQIATLQEEISDGGRDDESGRESS